MKNCRGKRIVEVEREGLKILGKKDERGVRCKRAKWKRLPVQQIGEIRATRFIQCIYTIFDFPQEVRQIHNPLYR